MGVKSVTVLCSGFGLGFYIPGVLISYNLKKKNIPTEVLVFESLIVKEKKEHIADSRKAYHENFPMALIATKLPMDIRKSIDYDQVKVLLESWKRENRRDFISLSGHWVYILDQYREMIYPESINVDLLYVDSDFAPSWKSLKKFNPEYSKHYSDIMLYDFEKKEIKYEISITNKPPIPFDERKNRLVVHGGGWGMGTYRSKLLELTESGFDLDIVAYDIKEGANKTKGDRYFMNNPSWSAWNKDENGIYDFPPYCEIKDNEILYYKAKKENHWLFDITRDTRAIVGKPGAGTLLDSLHAATPIILLEPFGKHEERNSELWEHLGYGIKYEEWKKADFSMQIVRDMHDRIVNSRQKGKDYVDDFIQRMDLFHMKNV